MSHLPNKNRPRFGHAKFGHLHTHSMTMSSFTPPKINDSVNFSDWTWSWFFWLIVHITGTRLTIVNWFLKINTNHFWYTIHFQGISKYAPKAAPPSRGDLNPATNPRCLARQVRQVLPIYPSGGILSREILGNKEKLGWHQEGNFTDIFSEHFSPTGIRKTNGLRTPSNAPPHITI